MPQETGLNLFLRSGEKKKKNVPQFGHEPKRRENKKKKKKGMENKGAADAATLRFSQLDPTDLWQGID